MMKCVMTKFPINDIGIKILQLIGKSFQRLVAIRLATIDSQNGKYPMIENSCNIQIHSKF